MKTFSRTPLPPCSSLGQDSVRMSGSTTKSDCIRSWMTEHRNRFTVGHGTKNQQTRRVNKGSELTYFDKTGVLTKGAPFIFFVIIVTGLTISCANGRQETASVIPSPPAEVGSADVDESDRVLYASLLDHPHVFEPGALEAVMRVLYFTPVETEPWSNKRPIFPEKTVQEAAPFIRKAFLEVKPYRKIQFRIQTEKGVTEGDTFILGDAFHWRFRVIEDSPQFEEFYNVVEFGSETSWPKNWVLVPQEGQRFYTSTLLDHIINQKFWVVMDLPPSPGKGTARDHESLMERLRLLGELKDGGLISEEQFQRKVRTLVDEKNVTVTDPQDRLLFLKELREKGLMSENEYQEKVQEILEQL